MVGVLLAVLALVLIGGGLFAIFRGEVLAYLNGNNAPIYEYAPIYEKEFGMDIKVVAPGGIGFNIDTDALHYGKISAGGTGTRFITLQHSYKIPLRVHATVEGQMGAWAFAPQNDLILAPNETVDFNVAVTVPKNATIGNYTGKLKLSFYKAQ